MASSALFHHTLNAAHESIPSEVRRAVELELDAICNDTHFRSSQRNCAFLRYVITETLSGRADEIKERTLGKELFGRPISYDTGSDAVVRVRANEVRKRLIVYYENHESQAGWRVHLPLRTYVPVFIPEAEVKQASEVVPVSTRVPVPAEARVEAAALIAGNAAPGAIPVAADAPLLPLTWMMIPALAALFLCAVTFRWQSFSGTPYLDFWEALLEGHAGVAVVLDADKADSRAVTTSDLEMVKPLLQTAALFHATTEIDSSDVAMDRKDLLAVHVTHHAPGAKTDDAAYITLIPGRDAQLWVGSRNGQALDLAIHSITDTDSFPIALEAALRRKTPTRLRFVDREQVLTESLPTGNESGDVQ